MGELPRHEKARAWLSLEDAKKPQDGEVLVDRWWIYHPEKGLLFVRFPGNWFAAQCNRDKRVTDKIHDSLYKDLGVCYMAEVYLAYDRNIKVEDHDSA
jgi:hypothetical protein